MGRYWRKFAELALFVAAKVVPKLRPLALAAALGVGAWLAMGWAEERGYLPASATGAGVAVELPSPTLPQATERRAPGEADRVASGGFCDARVELYISSSRQTEVAELARVFLRRHGVAFSEVDIDSDEHGCDRFNHLNPEKTLPFAIINGRQMVGFSPERWRAALAGEDS